MEFWREAGERVADDRRGGHPGLRADVADVLGMRLGRMGFIVQVRSRAVFAVKRSYRL